MKAQLAEANERINKLSADVNEKRGGSYKHHTLEELRNIQEQVQREKAVMALQREKELRDVSMERALLEEQRRQLEKDQVHCSTSDEVVLSKWKLWGMVLPKGHLHHQPSYLSGVGSYIRGICNNHSLTIMGQGLILLSYLIHLLLL